MNVAAQLDDPSICIAQLGDGQQLPAALSALLNPVDPRTFHVYRLPANTPVKLHYHDFDEYWSYHETCEYERTHKSRYKAGVVPPTASSLRTSKRKHLKVVKPK